MPIDSAANLIINDMYYTSIRLVNGKCFSTDLERECLPGICDCSGESLWFSHFYNVTQTSVVDISCSMIFGIHGTFSSRIQVKIIGNYIYIYNIYDANLECFDPLHSCHITLQQGQPLHWICLPL